MDVFDEVFSVLEESYLRIGTPGRVAVAVSGGADSMALLLLMAKLRNVHSFQMVCLHVDHGLRSESTKDAAFVKDVCEQWNIPFDQRELSLQSTSNIEAAAREGRYHALRAMAHAFGADVIATAHHAQDQAETVLMHLMYGAGGRGLSGMRELQDDIWRPLLPVSKEKLLAVLKESKAAWREDESNHWNHYTRNALRNIVFPQLNNIYPGCTARIVQTADILLHQENLLEETAKTWLQENGFVQGDVCWCDRKALLQQNLAMKRHIVLQIAKHLNIPLQYEHVQQVLQQIEIEKIQTVNLPMNSSALITSKRLHIVCQNAMHWPLGIIRYEQPAYLLGDGCFTQTFDADMIQGAVLRTRRTGDVFSPLGQQGSQSLKQYMMDRKLDRPFRDIWPVLALGHQILWVVGYGASRAAAVTENTKKAVYAVYHGILPDKRQNGEAAL